MPSNSLIDAKKRFSRIHDSADLLYSHIPSGPNRNNIKSFIYSSCIIGIASALEIFLRDNTQEIFDSIARSSIALDPIVKKNIQDNYLNVASNLMTRIDIMKDAIKKDRIEIIKCIADANATNDISNLHLPLINGPIGNSNFKKICDLYNFFDINIQALYGKTKKSSDQQNFEKNFTVLEPFLERRNLLAHSEETQLLTPDEIKLEFTNKIELIIDLLDGLKSAFIAGVNKMNDLGVVITPLNTYDKRFLYFNTPIDFTYGHSIFPISNDGKIIGRGGHAKTIKIHGYPLEFAKEGMNIGVELDFTVKMGSQYFITQIS